MSVSYIPAALRRLVEERANRRCEYCLLPENVSFYVHEIGLTPEGRTTVKLLQFNTDERLAERKRLSNRLNQE